MQTNLEARGEELEAEVRLISYDPRSTLAGYRAWLCAEKEGK